MTTAAAAYERALEIQPSAGEPLTALVRVDAARKQLPQALARLDKVIAAAAGQRHRSQLEGRAAGDARRVGCRGGRRSTKPSPRRRKWWMPYRGLALSHLAGKRNDQAIKALKTVSRRPAPPRWAPTSLRSTSVWIGPTTRFVSTKAMVTREPSSGRGGQQSGDAAGELSHRSHQPEPRRGAGRASSTTSPSLPF